MRALVVAEYYPRASDPTLGVWAHRQAVAARDAGAEVRVLVLHRPLPPLADLRRLRVGAISEAVAQPGRDVRDGIPVDYLRYLSPPRPWSYASWGAWAAPVLRRALGRLRVEFHWDLVHAHYAVPAGDAVRRAAPGAPLLVSVHGGDVHGGHAGASSVRRTLGHARLVLANSAGTARRCLERGAGQTRVVHLGTDLPSAPAAPPEAPTLVTVANLIARKRHADVIEALALLDDRWPRLRYVVVGDGPERAALAALAAARGLAGRVELRGRLAHEQAVAVAREASLFVLPSVAEAFGVSYVEAMAGGVPAIGSRGQDGPEEIAAAGGGIELVTPGDPRALADTIDALLSDAEKLAALRRAARDTVAREFTWERCGRDTVAAYEEVLRG
ncbi:MAG TPA: glycosyltransferase [Solirubrobacteraceae bacterium]|jgi:glycosyltransferase involved in cell wall biosynthesis|nr:glycosyltransferase [Solirubrobacteraceae bacterium]